MRMLFYDLRNWDFEHLGRECFDAVLKSKIECFFICSLLSYCYTVE